MTMQGNIAPAGIAGGQAIKSLFHSIVDQIFDERLQPMTPVAALDELRQIAMQLYEARRARNRVLPKALLGEPAWDMLLDLFATDAARAGVATKAVCLASDVPYSTAWRCLGALEADDLIERIEDREDGRRNLVRLTQRGEAAVRQCLQSLPSALARPAVQR